MDKTKLRNEFHKLIDNFEDDEVLENFYQAINGFKDKNNDIIDDLTDSQKKRLENSIKQSKKGQTISDNSMRQEIKKWLTK